MEEIWLARFVDYQYPSDSVIFGAYATEEEAQERCRKELENARGVNKDYPHMNDKKERNYTVESVPFFEKGENQE